MAYSERHKLPFIPPDTTCEFKMSQSHAEETFNLLALGPRGAGKTVFLAASCAQMQAKRSSTLWFDCEDSQSLQTVESILRYVERTGHYVPATIKITDFSFSLKRRSLGFTRSLCRFRWQDMPGELTQSFDPTFRQSVLDAHGCCVFIDAHALVHDSTYREQLEYQLFDQVRSLAGLVRFNGLKYPFALVLTKGDLLLSTPVKPELFIRPLTDTLDRLGAVYRMFYSQVTIEREAGSARLRTGGGTEAIPWLAAQVYRNYRPRAGSLVRWVSRAFGAPDSKAGVLHALEPRTGKRSRHPSTH